MNSSVVSNNLSLKGLHNHASGCKDVGISKFELVAIAKFYSNMLGSNLKAKNRNIKKDNLKM